MKYKCLVLDHDDTVVASSETIHYPSFIEYLKECRPEAVNNYTFESFLVKNFHPGITSLFIDELKLNEQEFIREQDFWAQFVENHIPNAYPGMKDIIERYLAEGGIVAVASHSYVRFIERDYKHNSLPMPTVIYGWDMEPELRKPSPYTIYDLMKRYELSAEDIIVVDDLKPGYDMARAAGVTFAAAGWAYDVPEIESFMREHCDYYFKTVEELASHLFG